MRSLMHSSSFRVLVMLWFSGWLVVVMPGHTRGIVQLPDAKGGEQDSCCQAKPPSCCQGRPSQTDNAGPSDTSRGGDKPTDPARHCAICFLKAHLTTPPPLTLYTPYLGELDELGFMVESSIADDLAAPALMRGRAPPQA